GRGGVGQGEEVGHPDAPGAAGGAVPPIGHVVVVGVELAVRDLGEAVVGVVEVDPVPGSSGHVGVDLLGGLLVPGRPGGRVGRAVARDVGHPGARPLGGMGGEAGAGAVRSGGGVVAALDGEGVGREVHRGDVHALAVDQHVRVGGEIAVD